MTDRLRRLPWRPLLVGGLVALGILRLALALSPPDLDIFADEARHGLAAMHILRGELPLFFYGQAYAGTLSDYLLALLFIVWGASPLTLKGLSFLLFLVHLGLTFSLAHRFLGPRTAAFAVLLAAIPPPVLFYWHHKAQQYYNLNLVLQDVVLLQTLVLLTGRRQVEGRWFVLGFVAGLAMWTHYLAGVFVLPAAIVLLVHDPRAVLARRGWLAVGGFLLGTLPVWAYDLTHQFQSFQGLRGGAGGTSLAEIGSHLVAFVRSGFPTLVAGWPPPGPRLALWAAAVGLWAAGLLWTLARIRQRAVALLGGVVLLTFGLNVLTAYGRTLGTEDVRHLVPAYVGLPLLVGHAAAALDLRAPMLPRLGVGGLLLANLILPRSEAWGLFGYRGASPEEAELRQSLDAREIRQAYGEGHEWKNRLLAWREAVIVAHPYQDDYLPYAHAVDAADRLAFVLAADDPATRDLVMSLPALQVAARKTRVGRHLILEDLTARGPQRCVGPQRALRVSGMPPGGPAPETTDGHLATRWTTGRPRQPGDTLVVEWTGTEPLAGLLLLPGHHADVPSGFVVEHSQDGEHWAERYRIPRYRGPLFFSGPHPFVKLRRGRVEVRFDPTTVRYHRLVHLGGDPVYYWSALEVFPLVPCREPPPPRSVTALLGHLHARGIAFVYADHWLIARLTHDSHGRIRGPSLNADQNSYGWRPIPVDQYETLRPKPGRAIVIAVEEGERIAAELSAHGITSERTDVGGFAVFTDLHRAPGGRPLTWWGLGIAQK